MKIIDILFRRRHSGIPKSVAGARRPVWAWVQERYWILLLAAFIVIVGLAVLLHWALASCTVLDFCLGALVGLGTDILVTVGASLHAFKFSVAYYRVNQVAEATREIPKADDRGEARNRHRYSLGVPIDELDRTFGRHEPFKEDQWPCLVHRREKDGQLVPVDQDDVAGPKADRWCFFDQYVRPVIDDINGFRFVGRYPIFPCLYTQIRRLRALTKLCTQLESAVREFDAAYGPGMVKIAKVCCERVIIQPVDPPDKSVARLREAYRSLHGAWGEWLSAVGVR